MRAQLVAGVLVVAAAFTGCGGDDSDPVPRVYAGVCDETCDGSTDAGVSWLACSTSASKAADRAKQRCEENLSSVCALSSCACSGFVRGDQVCDPETF